MMPNIIEKINALIERASHKSTPLEEARSCAMLAVNLIKKNDLIVSEKNPVITDVFVDTQNYNPTYNVPFDPSDFTVELKTFKEIITKSGGICKKCGKEYLKDTIIAEATEFNGQGIKERTHFQCRRYFIDGK